LKDFRLPGDDGLFRFINGLNIPALDQAFSIASMPVTGFVVAGALGLWLATTYGARALRPVLQAVIAAGAADLLGFRVLKPLIQRTRPNYALTQDAVRVLAEAANVGSMPSLHAATSFAVATTLLLLSPQVGGVALPIAFFISISRVGVGVHWPSDVFAGALLGATLAIALEAVCRKVFGVFDNRPEDAKASANFARGKANIEAARAEKAGQKKG
jgi:undecaprenyl-diphosphatase